MATPHRVDEMDQRLPFFSIIVPTFNRPTQLTACLQSLTYLDYARNRFEVIVVDDGSVMPPKDIVSSFCHQLTVTLSTQPHRGPAMARNMGAKEAKGEFLAFTDDDCHPAPNWLQSLAARFATRADHAIGGQTLNALPDNLYSTASQLIINYLYAYYNADPHQARFFTSNNLALPADRFRSIGGFNTTFPWAGGEDREFCERWLHHSYPLIYAPEVLVVHAHDLSLPTFWRQHFNYGRGGFRFHHLRACHDRQPFRIEPLSFYLSILRYPLPQIQGTKALLFLTLMVLSQGATAAGFLQEWIKQNWERFR